MARQHTAQLRADRRVWIVSDLHIGDGGPSESFAGKDDRFRAFLEAAATRADALVIAGDGFDVAQAWSLERIFDAHRPLVDDLVQLSRTMDVFYLRGNHEGGGAAIARALPTIHCAHDLVIGEGVRVEHGNAFDPHNLPGDRAAFWGARIHAMIEAVIRAPVRVPMRRHYRWSTRLGHWLFYRYGQAQEALARLERMLGRDDAAQSRIAFVDYWGRSEWGDAHGLLEAAAAYLSTTEEVDTLVCGHSHQPGKLALPGGTYVNTGSWTFDDSTFVVYEDGNVEARRWPDESTFTDERYRGVLGRRRDRPFFEWWEAYYEGWLSYDVEAMRRDCGD